MHQHTMGQQALVNMLAALVPRDLSSHTWACVAWGAVGLAMFPLLFVVGAPYGKLHRPGWGPTLNGRLGWALQELPSPLALVVSFNHASRTEMVALDPRFHPTGTPRLAHICVGLWCLHYLHRAVVYPMTRKMSPTVAPVVGSAIGFNLVNGYLAGSELGFLSAHLDHITWHVYAGFVMFLIGALINLHSDTILRGLRAGGRTGHFIPVGGLFEWCTCPHYFGEFIEWLGFALTTRTVSGAVFAWWTFANLLPRAVAYRRAKFKEEFPLSRKAMIPFVW